MFLHALQSSKFIGGGNGATIETLLTQYLLLIQVYIDGHPPLPLTQHSSPYWKFFHDCLGFSGS